MKGRTVHVVMARAMTARLAHAAGYPGAVIARSLGITPRGLGKLLNRPVDEPLLLAARLRVAIDAELDPPLR
ncbi:hypothetical protein KKA85_11995 [bacterium]|nr:hypothetical protein [bacterium]